MNTLFPSASQPRVHIGGYQHVQPGEIVLCRGDSNYTHIHFTNGRKLTVATTLGIIQERLLTRDFVRVNRSGLINKKYIACYDKEEVTLTNGTVLPVARRRRRQVWDSLKAQ